MTIRPVQDVSTDLAGAGSPASTLLPKLLGYAREFATDALTDASALVTALSAATSTSLDGKAPTVHTHTIAQVGSLQAALDARVLTTDLTTTLSGYAVAGHTHAVGGITGLTAALANKSDVGHAHTSASISDLTEAVQDIVGGFFGVVGGSVVYNDAANTLTVTIPQGSGSTDPEAVRDAIGAAMVGVGAVSVSYDDAADTITVSTSATANATDASLRDRSTHTGTQAPSTITGTAIVEGDARLTNARAPTAHTHDDRYYTEAEVDALLASRTSVEMFGDGSDGAVTFDGTTTVLGFVPTAGVYTLTREIHATTLTIAAGATVRTPFWIYARDTVTVAGVLHNDGNTRNDQTGASATVMGNAGIGQAGASSTTAAGGAGNGSLSGIGGAGGAGGAGAGGGGGAAGNVNTVPPINRFRSPVPVLNGAITYQAVTRIVAGGGGGGAGGGDGTNLGAGGGSAGGPLAVFARALVNNGTIRSAGGNGGTRATGNVGGGGGGGGGAVFIYTLSPVTGTGTIAVPGGAGGAGVGTGVAGAAGSPGNVMQVVL